MVDVGAAPGGFTQVAVNKGATVIGVDLLPIEPIPNAHLIQGDFTKPSIQKTILEALEGRPVDFVCSDMAPSFSGNHTADHARSMVTTPILYLSSQPPTHTLTHTHTHIGTL